MLSRLMSFAAGLLILAVLFLAGCASMMRDTVPPRVQLLGLQLQKAQLLEQRYLLKVRIQNPNDFDLDIRGVDFKVELNDEYFAHGVSNEAVNVPGFGEAVTRVLVSSSILTLARQLNDLNGKGVKYRVTGQVKMAGVPVPVSFENEGDLASLTK